MAGNHCTAFFGSIQLSTVGLIANERIRGQTVARLNPVQCVCVCVCSADQPTPHHQNTKSAPIVVAYRFARYSIFHCINLCYAVLSCSSVRFWMFMLFSAMFLDHFPFLRHASTFGHTPELSSVANCI